MRVIAKRHNLKTKDLLRLNPDIGRKPKANTVIIIPNTENLKITESTNISTNTEKTEITTAPVETTVEKIETIVIDNELEELKKSFVVHKVKPKETIYGLTRFYNISKEELFILNPSVEEEGLKIDQIIKIRAIKK